MEAEAKAPKKLRLRLWAEVQEAQARMLVVHDKIRDLTLGMKAKEFSAGLSEEELAAKVAKAKEERQVWFEEFMRLELFHPDLSGVTEDERAAEAERLRQEELEEGRRLIEAGDPRGWKLEALGRGGVIDFDPKQGGLYYNRFTAVDFKSFDLDEESPLGPMRFTDAVYKSRRDYGFRICNAVNIMSVKIACSDVGFPIHVYGTVIVRDSVDEKCVYHFRRDSHHCQLISSKDESLIFTGPKRGLALLDDIYVETDLKIRDHKLGKDRELSKGMLSIRGTGRTVMECLIETKSLATRLSTVDVTYAVVRDAVEATVAVEVVQGVFHGKITAYTTSIKDRILLYDSGEESAADGMTGSGDGRGAMILQLMRPVVCVYLEDRLIIEVQQQAGAEDGESRNILFTPKASRGDEDQLTVGATVMRVKVAWSVMDP
ncbi:hypothetical protein U9M48_041479 [Paspalum notatum var. saurae]|uniref:DUF6598 domain-containing protein n=1 Tax=Paspalum notatum var. saurae TaxID=547442 RepID=A0AAQ3XEW9_PASNO